MILQNIFYYADLLIKKNVILHILKTVVWFNIIMEY